MTEQHRDIEGRATGTRSTPPDADGPAPGAERAVSDPAAEKVLDGYVDEFERDGLRAAAEGVVRDSGATAGEGGPEGSGPTASGAPGATADASSASGSGTGTGADGPAKASAPVTEDTVEAVVRGQLSKVLGGKRGMAEAAVPTIAFTLTFILTRDVPLAAGLGVGSALALVVVRLVQRSTVQFVLNSLFGIGIAAFFALRSGQAEDAFLPGIIYNAVYAVVMIATILIRWPAVGLLIGSVTGDFTSWRENPAIVRLSSRLTWLLILPCVVRVAVQYPLWQAGMVGWLGASKLLMGWPIQVAGLAAMVWLLARGRTPMDPGSARALAEPAEPRGDTADTRTDR